MLLIFAAPTGRSYCLRLPLARLRPTQSLSRASRSRRSSTPSSLRSWSPSAAFVYRPRNLRFLRNLLDIYFVTNIAIIFLEYVIRWSLFPFPIGEGFETLQPWRASGFFGNGITAGFILAVYSIVNFALSMPFNFTRQCLTRLTLAFVSFLAIFTTGSRAAAGVTILILFAFMAISAVRQIASGRINRAAVIYGFFGLAVVPICLMVLLQLGLLRHGIGTHCGRSRQCHEQSDRS